MKEEKRAQRQEEKESRQKAREEREAEPPKTQEQLRVEEIVDELWKDYEPIYKRHIEKEEEMKRKKQRMEFLARQFPRTKGEVKEDNLKFLEKIKKHKREKTIIERRR